MLNKNFIPITNNLIFNYLFFHENNNILKEMLISILNLNIDPKTTNIKTSTMINYRPDNPILNPNQFIKNISNYKITSKKINIILSIDQNIEFCIELNTKITNNLPDDITKTNKIIINDVNTQEVVLYYLYHLDFKSTKLTTENIKEKYTINFEPIGNINFVKIFLPYYYSLYYKQKKKSTPNIMWIALLSSHNLKEVEEILNKLVDKTQINFFIESIKMIYCMDNILYTNLIFEKISNLNKYEYEQELKEKAYLDGFDQGYNDGVEEGYNEGLKDKSKKDN